jgi:hypothetical protein
VAKVASISRRSISLVIALSSHTLRPLATVQSRRRHGTLGTTTRSRERNGLHRLLHISLRRLDSPTTSHRCCTRRLWAVTTIDGAVPLTGHRRNGNLQRRRKATSSWAPSEGNGSWGYRLRFVWRETSFLLAPVRKSLFAGWRVLCAWSDAWGCDGDGGAG